MEIFCAKLKWKAKQKKRAQEHESHFECTMRKSFVLHTASI